jgi:hypothetical protein
MFSTITQVPQYGLNLLSKVILLKTQEIL